MNPTPHFRHIHHSKKFVDQCLADSQAWIKSSKFYDSDSLLSILLHAALEKSSVEDICQSSDRLPSPDTVMAQLAMTHCQSGRDLLEQQISTLFQSQVRKIPMFRGRRPPEVILALDLHDEEYYGNHLIYDQKRFTTFSTTKGRNALRYATLSIVSVNGKWDYPLTIGFACNYVGQSRQEVVQRLLSQVNLPMKIDCLLMDGGFNDADLFAWLDQEQIRFLVRGRFSAKKTYPGSLWSTFDYQTGSKKYPVRAFLSPRKRKQGDIETILLLSNHKYRLKEARILYKKRFRIENTYRQAKHFKIRTSTTKIQLRWIMWAFAHFLELIWQLVRIITKFLGLDSYAIRLKQFIRWLRDFWMRLTPHPIR